MFGARNCILAVTRATLPPALEDELKQRCVSFGGRAVLSCLEMIVYLFERDLLLNAVLVCLYHKRMDDFCRFV